jgi:hypothetical protein
MATGFGVRSLTRGHDVESRLEKPLTHDHRWSSPENDLMTARQDGTPQQERDFIVNPLRDARIGEWFTSEREMVVGQNAADRVATEGQALPNCDGNPAHGD